MSANKNCAAKDPPQKEHRPSGNFGDKGLVVYRGPASSSDGRVALPYDVGGGGRAGPVHEWAFSEPSRTSSVHCASLSSPHRAQEYSQDSTPGSAGAKSDYSFRPLPKRYTEFEKRQRNDGPQCPGPDSPGDTRVDCDRRHGTKFRRRSRGDRPHRNRRRWSRERDRDWDREKERDRKYDSARRHIHISAGDYGDPYIEPKVGEFRKASEDDDALKSSRSTSPSLKQTRDGAAPALLNAVPRTTASRDILRPTTAAQPETPNAVQKTATSSSLPSEYRAETAMKLELDAIVPAGSETLEDRKPPQPIEIEVSNCTVTRDEDDGADERQTAAPRNEGGSDSLVSNVTDSLRHISGVLENPAQCIIDTSEMGESTSGDTLEELHSVRSRNPADYQSKTHKESTSDPFDKLGTAMDVDADGVVALPQKAPIYVAAAGNFAEGFCESNEHDTNDTVLEPEESQDRTRASEDTVSESDEGKANQFPVSPAEDTIGTSSGLTVDVSNSTTVGAAPSSNGSLGSEIVMRNAASASASPQAVLQEQLDELVGKLESSRAEVLLPYLEAHVEHVDFVPEQSDEVVREIHDDRIQTCRRIEQLRRQKALLTESWNIYCSELDKELAEEDESRRKIEEDVFEEVPRRSRSYGDAARSEAEFLEILASLELQTARDPLARAKLTSAVIPPMIMDRKERAQRFVDTNQRVEDKSCLLKRLEFDKIDNFTDAEHEAFCQAYIQFPKQFGNIAKLMNNGRSFHDCVMHYYRTKKFFDYKQLLMRRKSRVKRGRKKKIADARSFEDATVHPETDFIAVEEGQTLDSSEDRTHSAESRIDEQSVDGSPKAANANSSKLSTSNETKRRRPKSKTAERRSHPAPFRESRDTSALSFESSVSPPDADVERLDVLDNARPSSEPQSESSTRATKRLGTAAEGSEVSEKAKRAPCAFEPNAGGGDDISQKFVAVNNMSQSPGLAALAASVKEAAAFEKNAAMPVHSNGITNEWSDLEVIKFERLLEIYGTHWDAISQHMTAKTIPMLQEYFFRHPKAIEYSKIAQRADEKNARAGVMPVFVPVTPSPINKVFAVNVQPPQVPNGPSMGYFAPRKRNFPVTSEAPSSMVIQSHEAAVAHSVKRGAAGLMAVADVASQTLSRPNAGAGAVGGPTDGKTTGHHWDPTVARTSNSRSEVGGPLGTNSASIDRQSLPPLIARKVEEIAKHYSTARYLSADPTYRESNERTHLK